MITEICKPIYRSVLVCASTAAPSAPIIDTNKSIQRYASRVKGALQLLSNCSK